jgi:O-antigen/teichoic acid export membrane protein
VAAVVNIALNFALIPGWRIAGSAAATLVSYVVLSILIRWRADREYKLAATPWLTQFQLAAGVGCAFLWSKAPTTTNWIIFRTALAALCVLWFVLVARSVVAGQPKPS